MGDLLAGARRSQARRQDERAQRRPLDDRDRHASAVSRSASREASVVLPLPGGPVSHSTAPPGICGRCAAGPASARARRSASPPPPPSWTARVDGQLRRQRVLVGHVDARHGGPGLGGAGVDRREVPPRPRACARASRHSSGHSSCTSAKRATDARARSRQARRCAVASMMTGTPAPVSATAANTSER